jgi:hypothetical protein
VAKKKYKRPHQLWCGLDRHVRLAKEKALQMSGSPWLRGRPAAKSLAASIFATLVGLTGALSDLAALVPPPDAPAEGGR